MHRIARAALRGALTAVTLLLLTGCATVVNGTALPETTLPAVDSAPSPGPSPGPVEPGPPGSEGELVADVLTDECLLDAEGLTLLLGEQVAPPAPGDLGMAGGQGSSCIATAATGRSAPIGAVNVYGVRGIQPAEHVRASLADPGRRELPRLGERAALVGAGRGQALHIAQGRFLISIIALRTRPSDAEWTAAGTAALTKLPA